MKQSSGNFQKSIGKSPDIHKLLKSLNAWEDSAIRILNPEIPKDQRPSLITEFVDRLLIAGFTISKLIFDPISQKKRDFGLLSIFQHAEASPGYCVRILVGLLRADESLSIPKWVFSDPKIAELYQRIRRILFKKSSLDVFWAKYPILLPDSYIISLIDIFAHEKWTNIEFFMDSLSISPALLGARLEFRNNQRVSGIYFTGEDVTAYMVTSSLFLHLVQKIQQHLSLKELWDRQLTQVAKNPERYIYSSMLSGMKHPLPSFIEAGINDPDNRTNWQTIAENNYTNRGEIWREVIVRHQWIDFIHSKIKNDPKITTRDLITWNLNLERILEDLLVNCIQNKLETAFLSCITQIRILDPMCGAGSFLLAAFGWVQKIISKLKQPPEILADVLDHQFYGVDLIPDAVRICRWRLILNYLTSINQLSPKMVIPTLESTLRAGNALVGYIHLPPKSTDSAQTDLKLTYLYQTSRFEIKNLDFIHNSQVIHWECEFPQVIQTGGFDVIIGNPPYLEMAEIAYIPTDLLLMKDSSFINRTFPVHGWSLVRALNLLKTDGTLCFIVPMALISTQRMHFLQMMLETAHNVWYANFSWRPGKLFEEVNRALTIVLVSASQDPKTYATNYQRWYERKEVETRSRLFEQIKYYEILRPRLTYWVPKPGNPIDLILLSKIQELKDRISLKHYLKTPRIPKRNFSETILQNLNDVIFYRSTGGLYWKVFTTFLPGYLHEDRGTISSRTKVITVISPARLDAVVAFLNSDWFWWWYTQSSNLRDLNPSDIINSPVTEALVSDLELARMGHLLMDDLQKHSHVRTRHQTLTNKGENQTQHFLVKYCKSRINEIDVRIADIMGFSKEEVDYIQNYDIKFRMNLLRNQEILK